MSNKVIITEPSELLVELNRRPSMNVLLHMIPARGLSVAFESGGPQPNGADVDRESVLQVLKMMSAIREGKPVLFYDPKRDPGKWQWVAGSKKS
jgi:hypothetical protein